MGNLSRHVRRIVVMLAVVTLVGSVTPIASAAQPRMPDTPGFTFKGLLPLDAGDKKTCDEFASCLDRYVVATDTARQLMYYIYYGEVDARYHLVTYDLRPRMPKPIKDILINANLLKAQPYTDRTMVRDSRRNRLLISALGSGRQDSIIIAVDLNSGETVGEWHIQCEPPGPGGQPEVGGCLPTMQIEGITYSAEDDRIYVIGETVAHYGLTNLSGERPQTISVAAALNAADGKLEWALPLHACPQPLNTLYYGALIARSTKSDAIYVPCAQSDAAPGPSGIARIVLGANGGKAKQPEALTFKTEYFPVSGRFQNELILHGITASTTYDYVHDRVFLQSLSGITPGAWVFDGRLSGWVGFIAFPSQLHSLGVNSRNGHFYAADFGGPLVVADAHGTPVPQGIVYPYHSFAYIVPDEGSNRVFVKWSLSKAGFAQNTTAQQWAVMEDTTAAEPELADPNWDALTTDTPESDKTESTFAGGITGYGSRLYWVGGWSGGIRATPVISVGQAIRDHASTPPEAGGFSLNDLGFQPGDRGLMMARVAALDMRAAGSSATAQAVQPDSGTLDEWNGRGANIEGSCDRTTTRMGLSDEQCQGAVDEQLVEAAKNAPTWPWNSATCLDGGGSEQNPPAEDKASGRASVTCSFDDQRTEATSSFGRLELQPPSSGGPAFEIASSYFHAESKRDPKLGTVSTATASASGIHVETSAGSVSIGRVIESVTTVAHGRPGTTSAVTERHLREIVLKPASGPEQHIDGCDKPADCATVIAEMNRILGAAVRVELPQATITATKKGAFAGFEKATGQYYNDLTLQNDDTRSVPALKFVLFADSEQKSRIVVQLAAIESTSIYTIAPGFDFGGGDDGGGLPLPVPVQPPLGGGLGGGGEVGGSGQPSVIIPPNVAGSLGAITAFLVRSPMEAMQFGSILLLFAIAVTVMIRRRGSKAFLDEGGAVQ